MAGTGTITLIDPQGIAREVPVEAAGNALESGFRAPTETDRVNRAADAAREATYGGAGGAAIAGLAGAARGATLGLSDAAARLVGGEDAAFDLSNLRDVNPGISTASEIGGALAPALLSGGASLPASLAGRLGVGVAERLGGGLLARAAGGAAEGAIFGAGQGVSELALSDDPLSVERVGSVISSNALLGGALGGAAGLVGGLAETGLSKAKASLDSLIARKAEAEAAKVRSAIEPITAESDIATLDARGLLKAEQLERDSIRAAQAPERVQFADDLKSFYSEAAEAKISKIVTGTSDAEARRAGAALRSADTSLRKITDNKIALAEKPEKALYDLQKQKQALEDIRDFIEEETGQFFHRFRETRAEVAKALAEDNLDGYVRDALQPRGQQQAIKETVERRLKIAIDPSGNPVLPEGLQRADEVNAAIQRNLEIQDRIAKLTADPQSERLSKIEEARAALGIKPAEQELSLGRELLSAAVPLVGGPVAAVAATVGKFRRVADVVAKQTGKTVSAVLDVTKKVTPHVPRASAVLGDVAYASRATTRALGLPPSPSAKAALPELFKARTNEVKAQTFLAGDGTYQIKPQARQEIATRLDGVRRASPILADRLETHAVRRLEYLASHVPRRPDVFSAAIGGPDRWQPSDLEMRAWARRAAAVEDPHAALERVISGTATPEDADALRNVHPEILADFIGEVSARLPTLRHTLPYPRRVALSLFTGVPVDPALHPEILNGLQAQFATEPGTLGGVQAPKAQPQFGSIRKSLDAPTPAQHRSEGART